MPKREIILTQNEIYHVFNRGIMRMPIFKTQSNYLRFLELVNYYRFSNTPISYSELKKVSIDTQLQIFENLYKQNILHVEILTYCLMPNHFHFIMKQISERGISTFMGNLLNGYTKYFNVKNNRVGPLYQSSFKVVRIETDEQFLHTCRYVHLNPSTSFIVAIKELVTYKWSSYPSYMGYYDKKSFLNTSELSNFFKSNKNLEEFTLDQADYQRTLDQIKHLLLE